MIQVVNETLRVANVIGGVFRRAMTDVEINGKLYTNFEIETPSKKKICEMKMSQLQNAKTFLHEEKKQVIRFQKGGRCSYRLEEFI